MPIDHAILGVISFYPCSGYDVKKELEQGGAGLVWSISFGSVYPRLKRLEQRGLVRVVESSTGGRQRRVYDLTARGWQELGRWLARPPKYPLPWRDELLLKMGFWGTARPEDRASLVEHLRVRKARSQQLFQRLLDWSQNGVSAIDEYGTLILSYARAHLEAELAWIDRATTQLGDPPRPPHQDGRGLFIRSQERRSAALQGKDGETPLRGKDGAAPRQGGDGGGSDGG